MNAPRLAPAAWTERAACIGTNPDYWDLDQHPRIPRFARELCLRCPVLAQCALSARADKATGVIRAAVECRRTTAEFREDTDAELSRAALVALIADGTPPARAVELVR
ncbi:hypothetical protein GCM10027289_30130 [Tsukamurella serpentis]